MGVRDPASASPAIDVELGGATGRPLTVTRNGEGGNAAFR
jgi:hypothetical protein